MDIIDLHAHTTASDGTLSPAELVGKAREIGLKAVAVTDHDTVEGLPEAIEEGRRLDFEVVPGVEISAEYSPGSMHILGYFLDPARTDLARNLEALQEARLKRNPTIAANLRRLGYDITMEEVEAAAGGGQVGRPHFARVLVDKGLVAGVEEAFNKLLTKGAPAYADKFRYSPEKAVSLILEAGGVPVLAHPNYLRLDRDGVTEVVARLTELGLSGLEVYYTTHTPQDTEFFLGLAKRFNLAPTGGSDFHGNNKPDVHLGSGRGNLKIPYALLDDLKKKRKD